MGYYIRVPSFRKLPIYSTGQSVGEQGPMFPDPGRLLLLLGGYMKDLCLLFSCPCLRYCKGPSFRLCMPYTSLNTPYEVLIMGIKAPSPLPLFWGLHAGSWGLRSLPRLCRPFGQSRPAASPCLGCSGSLRSRAVLGLGF